VFQTVPGYKAPVEALFGLASTPFRVGAFRPACEQFATFDESSSDADLWYFSVGGPRMIVGLDGKRVVRFAVLSICWWDSFLPAEHPSRESFEAERAEFDRLYAQELEAATGLLGPPKLAGRDRDEDAHRWAVWRGRTGILVLQQSAYDPQFGLDVNYWLHPWEGAHPRPSSPFIDWLFGVSGGGEEKTEQDTTADGPRE
jgi:hypothetical protein